MLLTTEKMRLFTQMACSRVRADDLTAYCNNVVELPQVSDEGTLSDKWLIM